MCPMCLCVKTKKQQMLNISIISSSIRPDRNSHRVALYFKNYLTENNLANAEILDLKEFNFPLFDNPLKHQKNPSAQLLDFAKKVKATDGIIIVTPEYNGSFPASLKNVIDVLYDEWHGKPISIATVSAGALGGSQALVALQFVLWKIGAWTVTNMFHVAKVQQAYDASGNVMDDGATDKLTKLFVEELIAAVEANTQVQV
jgi:NAD(P)H-dependent FMN reductase